MTIPRSLLPVREICRVCVCVCVCVGGGGGGWGDKGNGSKEFSDQ